MDLSDPLDGSKLIHKSEGGGRQNGNYQTTIDINSYPQQARWRIMNKDTQYSIVEMSGGVALVNKGIYVPPGKKPTGIGSLRIILEADTEQQIRTAVKEIRRILEQETLKLATGRTLGSNTSAITSRYGAEYGEV